MNASDSAGISPCHERKEQRTHVRQGVGQRKSSCCGRDQHRRLSDLK